MHNLKKSFWEVKKHVEQISVLDNFIASNSKSTFTFYMITCIAGSILCWTVIYLRLTHDKYVVICGKQYHVIHSSSVFLNFRITVCVDSVQRRHDTACLLRNIIHWNIDIFNTFRLFGAKRVHPINVMIVISEFLPRSVYNCYNHCQSAFLRIRVTFSTP